MENISKASVILGRNYYICTSLGNPWTTEATANRALMPEKLSGRESVEVAVFGISLDSIEKFRSTGKLQG